MTTKNTTVLDARAVERTLKRMSVEIVELNRGTDDLIIVGIQRRGVQLADRLVKMIEGGEGVVVPQGSLDITLYRDDLQTVGPRPVVGPTHLPWDLEGKHIVIVDDVLYTGRTVRAALDELADFGRPGSISLAVLIDRGGRELPIHADVVGKKIDVGPDERVDVMVAELDERTEVVIVDDVLHTGRTVRAALDELADFGRPARIALAVLVDRGGRELPIHADIVGKRVDVAAKDRVDVLVSDLDGEDSVVLVRREDVA